MFLFLVICFMGLSFDRLNIFKYCILSCIAHEAGHIFSSRICTGKWPQIKAGVFGLRMKNNVALNKHYIAILFSGPFVNIFLTIITCITLKSSFSLNKYIFMLVNAIVFIFNMLPIYYLDGGQILYSKSLFYQKHFNQISSISLLTACVMLFHFTDNLVLLLIPVMYFIINLANDI